MSTSSAQVPPTDAARRERCLVVISYYDQRSVASLIDLLESLARHPAGGAYDVCVVVNEQGARRVDPRGLNEELIVLHRPNSGMNIGAWAHGWRANPGYRDYLFLQDECYAVAAGWLAALRARSEELGSGLLGESMNRGWNLPWDELRERHARSEIREHTLQGQPANRVDVYLDFMRRHDIDPGSSGLHLRSLVWYAGGALLAEIDGFAAGTNYGECIASEIAASRKVIARRRAVAQVAERPFRYFRHREWKEKFPGGPFRHFRDETAQ